MAKIVPMVQKLSVGPPEEDCDITPVISESSANFFEGLVKDAREKGEPPWAYLKPYDGSNAAVGLSMGSAVLALRLHPTVNDTNFPYAHGLISLLPIRGQVPDGVQAGR